MFITPRVTLPQSLAHWQQLFLATQRGPLAAKENEPFATQGLFDRLEDSGARLWPSGRLRLAIREREHRVGRHQIRVGLEPAVAGIDPATIAVLE